MYVRTRAPELEIKSYMALYWAKEIRYFIHSFKRRDEGE
jgi:hypothetical protein